MAAPGKPRQSGIPAPGRTGIPTPGRSRSASSVLQSAPSNDVEDMSRALANALKANDPAQHRPVQLDSQSSSPRSIHSGRRSVADRPNAIRPPERAKTPAATRPISRSASRQSDVHAKAMTRQFDIGDNVRIDSLALEGVLRYLGEIEGKNGLWAGVELSARFAGKGKNNGSVNGIRYFSCPQKCGVFVATTKLSPSQPYHSIVPRPSSVTSSRSGRASTSSISGRITPSLSTSRMPSLSNGSATPSVNGRSSGMVTPGVTPSTKSSYLSKSTLGQKGDTNKLSETITPGSRAAKYANMTAKQLTSRKENASSPIRQVGEYTNNIPSSPSPISRTLSSPSRPPGSPFSTPKPSLNGRISNVGPCLPSTRGRTSQTPRGRVPSAVAMPPPASPMSAISRSTSLSKPGFEEFANLELQGKALQDRISILMGEASGGSSEESVFASSSNMPSADDRILELQARVEALEVENSRLLSDKEEADAGKHADYAQKLAEERTRTSGEMENLVKNRDELLKVHEMTVADLEELRRIQQAGQQQISELEKRLAEQLDQSQRTSDTLHKELAEVVTKSQKLEQENQMLQTAKTDLKMQNDELGVQVDELRLAGQETIALYEERLSIADGQRYDLESRIASLERATSSQEIKPLDQDNHRSATEIDNEALRDQILYLQKKITSMEDLMEDSRAANEREEATLRERMKRLKEKEENMKLELSEGKREVERMAKAEAGARNRVEEIEEALRESQVALENARAEIETLRAELANIDGLQRVSSRSEQPVVENSESDLREENSRLLGQNNALLAKITELTSTEERKGLNSDILRTSLTLKSDTATPREEITGLKHIVQELQKEHMAASQRIKLLESENDILKSETKLLQSEADRLHQEIQGLEKNVVACATNDKTPEAIGTASSGDIQRSLKDQKAEVEQLRKRLAETETKHARTTHDLNKEISELEALVESKIYREDELEQEVERLREKLSKVKKSTRPGGEFGSLHHQPSLASMKSSDHDDQRLASESLCEICERPGHDIFTCDLLKKDAPNTLTNARPSKEFCDDCESYGHASADCPHSQDVF